jgi:GPI mannosyltransferase 3
MRATWTPAQRWGFVAILLVAAALRAWTALTSGPVHPDEIFQYLEQAHRTVFGNGVVTWEYRYGMRSWLLPLLLSVPMRIGAWIAPASDLYLILPQLTAAALSLLLVVGAYGLGARCSRFHGFVAMAVAATWYDIVYFGGHVLTEPASTALILAASAYLLPDAPTRRQMILAGLLLGFAGILRFHYLPAMAVLVLLSCRLDWRGRWLPLILGGLGAAALGAAVDLFMGQAPFGWIVVNFTQNIVADRSSGFGVQPPLAYLDALGRMWGLALVALLLLIVPVMRPYRALILAALANLLLHSLVGHKEYRFIFLTVAIIVVVAAIGSAELARRLRPRLPSRTGRIFAFALVPVWLAASGALAAEGRLQSGWRVYLAGSQAAVMLRTAPGLCGVGLVGIDRWDTGGYTLLRRPVPFYLVDPPVDIGPQIPVASLAPAFNGVLAPEFKAATLPAGYRAIGCSAPHQGVDAARMATPLRVCAFVRDGGCDPAAGAAQELQAVMKRQDW